MMKKIVNFTIVYIILCFSLLEAVSAGISNEKDISNIYDRCYATNIIEVVPSNNDKFPDKYVSSESDFASEPDTLHEQVVTVHHYYTYVKDPKEDNYLNIDNNTAFLIDSLFSSNEILDWLEKEKLYLRIMKKDLENLFRTEYKRLQKDKSLEAKANLAWLVLSIVCLTSLLLFYKNDTMRYILILLFIAGIIGTLNSLPDFIHLIKGQEWNIFSEIG